MKQVKIYTDSNNHSNINDYLKVLEMKNDKDSNLNHEKILDYLCVLSQFGVKIGYPYVRHLRGKIWELRPLNNRILFFESRDAYVLLNHFKKETSKTPREEIIKATKMMKDYLERNK